MAVSDNGQPKARFHPYVPQPEPDVDETGSNAPWPSMGPDDEETLLGERQQEADVWTFDPDIKLPNDAYRGVRRAAGRRSYRRIGLVVGAVVVAVAALVFALKPGAGTTDRAPGSDSLALLPSDVGAGETSSSQLSATAGPTPVAASPVSIPVFAPLTFEAEAGPPTVKRHGADVETLAGASGGKVVRFAGGSGEIAIRGVDFTVAGTYRITIYYATAAAGTAVVTIQNAAPLTVNFVGGSGCCAAGAVDVALPSGQRTISVSEVTSGVAIDRVVITRTRP
jgi:hypothetical protein